MDSSIVAFSTVDEVAQAAPDITSEERPERWAEFWSERYTGPGELSPATEVRSQWATACLTRIAMFKQLERGWDSYDAAPPNEHAASLARRFIQWLDETKIQMPDSVDPSVEDGVCVSFRHGQGYADFEFFNTGEVVASVCQADGTTKVWESAPTRERFASDFAELMDLIRR